MKWFLVFLFILQVSHSETYPPLDYSFHIAYSAERKQLHDTIVSSFTESITQNSSAPEIVILAGPMASGKSKLVPKLRNGGNSAVRIDIDAIRKRLPEFATLNAIDPTKAVYSTQTEAGYIAELIFWKAVEKSQNIIFESSLRDTDFLKSLKEKVQIHAPQYSTRFNLVFAFADLKSLYSNVSRRNEKKERFTPLEDMENRYYSAMTNFFSIKDIFDQVVAIDKSWAVQRVVYYEGTQNGSRVQQGISLDLNKTPSLAPDYVSTLSKIRPPNRGYDLFFDIDWTLFYSLTDPSTCEPEKLIRYESQGKVQFFRLADHVEEFFRKLLDYPDVRIHFMSGADQERAEFLLSKIVIKTGDHKGKSAMDFKTSLSSISELLEMSKDDPKFTNRYGKYVQKIVPNIDMTRAGLFDDSLEFTRFGIPMVDSYGIYTYRNSFDPKRVGQNYEAPSLEEFNIEKNRWFSMFDVFKKAYELDKSGQGRFSDWITKTPWIRSSAKVNTCLRFYVPPI